MPTPPRRIGPGLLLAPLAGPPAVFVGSLVYALARHTTGGEPFSIPAAFVLLFAYYLFGAPLSYAGLLLIAWPVASVARARGSIPWWAVALASGAVGGMLFPVYLHLLEPRGSFTFFPGAGFLAGAAVGAAFWAVSLRTGPTASR